MKLSVLMPVYNEAATLRQMISKIQNVPIDKEIIIVDDGSTDGCRSILEEYEGSDGLKVLYHSTNEGKGSAIRTALSHITGDIVIIQDADLETEPHDYLELVKPIVRKETKVVYGSRLLKSRRIHNRIFFWGGRFVTFVANLLYNQQLTDEPTCYKVFDAKLLKSIPLNCKRFDFCPEVTAKVARQGIKIKELPIHYFPRSMSEGKKLRWYDGMHAVWTLLKYRLIPIRNHAGSTSSKQSPLLPS